MSLEYNKNNIVLAKNLRKNMTPYEKRLWYDFLSKHKLRFQRQKAIDNFIADFYCHKAKLVIELDGEWHKSEQAYTNDQMRTEILKEYDLTVVRISNSKITDDFIGVCEYIDNVINSIIE